jgi:hypothetical protein
MMFRAALAHLVEQLICNLTKWRIKIFSFLGYVLIEIAKF